MKLNYIMSTLRSASHSLNIVILDACRSGFVIPGGSRDLASEGLAKIGVVPRGSIVLFAAEPGKTASDGTGKNGLLTSKLLKHINESNVNVNEVFRLVKNDVFEESKEAQLPMLEDASTGGSFYFSGAVPVSTAPAFTKQDQSLSQLTTVTTAPTYKPFDYGYGAGDAPTVDVGNQQWLGKNLNVTTFVNGDPISQAQTAEEWKQASYEKRPAWCYYNNDPANGRTYGKLYNWYAVHDPRGLAPAGWHVPSDTEWTQLTDYLGGEATAGTKMKSVSLWENNGNGDNSSRIAGLPGGGRFSDGAFDYVGKKRLLVGSF